MAGATEPAHKFRGFWHLMSANGGAHGVVASGVRGDRLPPVPITVSVGGVKGLGGVSEEYVSTAAYCIQLGE